MNRVYQVLGENVTDEDIDEMLRMCDQDGDGQMTFDEFARMIFRHSGPPKVTKKPKTHLLTDTETAEIMTAEKAMTSASAKRSTLPPIKKPMGGKNDPNGNEKNDGKRNKKQKIQERERVLSAKERADRAFVLNNMIKLLDFENKNLDAVQEAFKQLDNNDQGNVNYQQFAKALNEDMNNHVVKTLFSLFEWNDKVDYREFLISVVNITAPNRDQKIQFAFNIFDSDNNGYIDRDELIKILKSAHMTSYEQVSGKADSILKAADQDGNDLLTLEELTNVVIKFPNLVFPDFNILRK